jgi:uncharacterized iron-regulated membrane protein
MTTNGRPGETRPVWTLAGAGAGLGLLLAGSRSTGPGCAAAAHQLAACAPEGLLGVKALVTAAVVGLLLGALIGVAAVLAWREARATVAAVRVPARPRPRAGVAPAERAAGRRAMGAPRAHR